MNKDDFERLVNEARTKSVLDYFRESGYKIEKKGNQHYVADIPGLVIKENSNQWYYHYENIGRTNNTLDCLTKVVGLEFKQAVFELTGKDISHFKAEQIDGVRPKYTSPPTKAIILHSIAKRTKNTEQKIRMSRKPTKAYCRMVRRMTQTYGFYVSITVWFAIEGSINLKAI